MATRGRGGEQRGQGGSCAAARRRLPHLHGGRRSPGGGRGGHAGARRARGRRGAPDVAAEAWPEHPSQGPRRPATIPESNSGAIAALARQAGADVRVAPIVRDDPAAVDRALGDALDGADVVVTVGGVSVGDYDVVRPALERAGVVLDYWRVAVKPGKPLAFGRRGDARVLGLPGNPASAIVTFVLFGMPLLRALHGDARPVGALLPARLGASRKRPADRLELVRCALSVEGAVLVARAHDNQSSGAATSLASSDGIAFVPAGSAPIEAGAVVDFLRWADA